MYSDGVILLSSITTIAAAAVAILWFLFGRRENSRIPTLTVTNNNTAASDSSSAANSAAVAAAVVYEVFLSFCGKDTRKGFTDFLYTYLVGASIQTFRDDNELRVGQEIGPELLKAINESKISIPILSKNYASSKWCLLELAQMVECHSNGGAQMIYPIFYDVDPSDVRNQTGSYRKSFRQHEKKFDKETVQSWREALKLVGGLKGLELMKETDGHQGKLVKIVVEKVLLELKKNYTHIPKNLVGMENHVEEMKRLLKVDSNSVRIVGIHGMGGLGKTTIAKVLYNQLYECFDSHCFLENVRENSKRRDGILDLQKQLISKIQNRGVPEFVNVNEGRGRIKDIVCGRKVLIVLDDVDEISQVDMLIGNQSWFGAHSRIIITTRDTDVLCAIEMACHIEGLHDVCTSYKPEYMDNLDSLQLFSKYAFMRDSPVEGYEHLSEEAVSIAAGLPLVLVVLGSTFFLVKGKEVWEEKLRRLRAIPHKEVLEKLRFSFEALEYEHKQIFLDIACLFIGRDVTIPSYMWDDCGFYPREGISVLVSKSLITVGDYNELIMHDQLRDLGRQIVREEGLNELGKRSRLWREEEAMQILVTSQGTSSVNALCLPRTRESPLLASSFHDVPNLRYLSMSFQDIDRDFKNLLSNLRWLEWNLTPNSTPTNLQMKNLVILDLSFCRFTEDWECWNQFKMAKKLKLLDLTHCYNLRVLPHLSMYQSLEILKFASCVSLCRLDGIEQLKSLKYLDVSYNNLKTLPNLSNLTNLVELNLENCSKLIEIQGLEKLESLQVLDITGCQSLERLPDLSDLKKLNTFDARMCDELIEIEGLEKLESLEYLVLWGCISLERLPDLSNLKKLNTFNAYTCWKLIEIEGLEKLETLEYLDLGCCTSLERLPEFSNLTRLKTFKATGSAKLIKIVGLDKLNSLEHLDLWGCDSLKGVVDMSNLNNLKELLAPTLEVTNFSNLKKLKELAILFSEHLIEFQSLDGLDSMRDLHIWGGSMKRLPDLSCLKRLKELEIRNWDDLIEIQDLDGWDSLKIFKIGNCPSLKRLPDFRSLKNLNRLVIDSLKELVKIHGLDALKSLEILYISGCESIEALSDFSNLEKLRVLCACGCVKLTEIRGLEKLKSLKQLDISGCKSIEALSDISNLKKLTDLKVSGCVNLTEIRGLEKLQSLEELDISGCKSIEALPDISNLKKLTNLKVSGCVKLTEIRGLEESKSLKYLYV